MSPHVSRRGLLAGAGAAVLGGTLLSGCGSGSSGAALASGTLKLPTYTPLGKGDPDLPPVGLCRTEGYYRYPKDQFRSVSGTPASGGTISALVAITAPPPKPRAQNAIWQASEKAIGARMDLTMITQSDYKQRFTTTIAGDDIPDFVLFQKIANYAQLLQAKFADLSEFLGGDAVREYPNLANIPTVCWQQAAVGSKLYGLPLCRNGMQGPGLYHKEMFDEVGGYPKDADEFFAYLKELTRPSKNRWGIIGHSESAYSLKTALMMFRAPLNWRLTNGKLVKDIETDEHREAVAYLRKLFRAGVFHPDSNAPNNRTKNLFNNGSAAVSCDTVTGLLGAVSNQAKVNPTFQPRAMTPIGHDGKPAGVYQDFVINSFAVLRRGSDKRIAELLRVADYLAAPLGSVENQLLNYGEQGRTFTFDDRGIPQLTPDHVSDSPIPWGFIVNGPMQLFDAENSDTVKWRYDGVKRLSTLDAVADPTVGQYSNTDATKGAAMTQTIMDTCTSIIAGRKPMSAYDEMVKQWRAGGGDTIRGEYEKSIEKSGVQR